LRPREARLHLDLGDTLYGLGRRLEAAAAYDEAVSLDPTCLVRRSASEQARQDLTLSALREEVRSRRDGRAGSVVLHLLLAAGATLGRLVKRRKGLDLVISMLVLLPIALTGAALLPPWVRHYLLYDEVVRIARLPTSDEAAVRAQLTHAVRKRGLDPWLDAGRCSIRSGDRLRRINCDYTVPLDWLPGFTSSLRFQISVEEPFLVEKPPLLL